LACKKYGSDEVMQVIEDTIICYSSSGNTPPLSIAKALVISATDKNIHLDCVYFLLWREPDVLQKLLSSTPVAVAGVMDNSNNVDDDDENNNVSNNDENDDNLSKTKTTNPKK
jgi:hypothetical protein